MLKQYLRILKRNIVSSPLYSIVNITGLTLSLAASLLIYLWIYDELSYDKIHDDHQNIYRLLTYTKSGIDYVKTPSLPLPMAAYLRDEYAQVASATFIKFESEAPLQIGEDKIEVRPAYIDAHFFDVFTGFRFVEGNIETALKEPRSIILSQKTVRILFGEDKAIGKILESNKYNKELYTVGGVVVIPENSHIDFGFATLIDHNFYLHRSFTNNWRKSEWSSVYMKLKKNSQSSDEFIAKINTHFTEKAGRPKRVLFQPIANIHLFSDYTWPHDRNIGESRYLLIFGAIAIAVVILAVFNFILLTIARSSERFNEIGYRKIVGATRPQVFMQYMMESFVQVMFAIALGILLVYLLIPWFNNLTGKSIYFIPSLNFIGTTCALALLISILAGLYPAFYLSSYNPLLIFKGGNPTGSKQILIKALITSQSAIASFLLIFTVMVNQQLRFINQTDLGLSKDNVVIIPTGLWYDNASFKNELLAHPDILSATFSTRSPANFHNKIPLTVNGIDTVFATMYWVDKDFAKTYHLNITEGEFLKTTNDEYWNFALSKKDSSNKDKRLLSIPMVINETARDMLQLEDPIGERIGSHVVIGVVKDFHIRPLQHKIEPLVMYNNPENIMTLNVKINGEQKAETIAFIKEVYSKHRENRGFSYSYFEDELNDLYHSEHRMEGILEVATTLSFIISLLGIFSLASYGVQRKRQEIGIRKINGAGTRHILMMLNSDLLRWVLVAYILALPLSVYAVNQWLMSYAYRVEINWLLIIFIGLLIISVSLLSISWQCWKAARTNPIDVLRYE